MNCKICGGNISEDPISGESLGCDTCAYPLTCGSCKHVDGGVCPMAGEVSDKYSCGEHSEL